MGLGKAYDFVVLGSGPSGRRSAIQAAKLGKKVLVVENRKPGGVSVHTGTIPSKTVRETVLNLTGFRERNFYSNVVYSAAEEDLYGRVKATQEREVEVLKDQFARNNVELVSGSAKFLDPNMVEIIREEGVRETVEAQKFVIAVGTYCYRPRELQFDGRFVCDSDQFLSLNHIPKSVVVIGAGVIGVEYASILNVLGREVTLVDPRENYLEFIDREIIAEFTSILRTRGVSFRLGRKLTDIISASEDGVRVALDNGEILKTGMVLYAAGRVGATSDLGLENCGLSADSRGRITVNRDTFQTEKTNIYAVGDVVGFPALASTSMAQGRIAACHAFGEEIFKPSEFYPYGIYSVPEISTCGMSQTDAEKLGKDFVVGSAKFSETSRGQIMGTDCGFLKLIFSQEERKLLGVHIIGEGAAELIHIGQAVLRFGGGVDYFVENIFNFPTLAEAYKVAALNAWNKLRTT